MVQLKNLEFGYGKGPRLFEKLELVLKPGNIYGLLGKNGAGKTSLLRIIAGILAPKAGECRFLDRPTFTRAAASLADIYFVPEEIDVPDLTIRQYRTLYSGFYPRFSAEVFESYLADFGLSDQERLRKLSFGQRKKFFIAFGVATGTRLVILDEPTNGLDIPTKSLFRRMMVSAVDEQRIFIISTHQVRDIQNLIDPVLILDQGRIIFHRSMDEINRFLTVNLAVDEPESGTCLYFEKVIGGYALLYPETGSAGNVDLELLFNAAIHNPDKLNQVFAGGEAHA